MDDELMRLVQAVEKGSIRETEQAREILADARRAISKLDRRLSKMKSLAFRAEQAFVEGWPKVRPV